LQITLNRAKFEALTAELVKWTIKPLENCLKDAGVTKDKLDEILLVGGMTRMPKVQQQV
jgi:molecular chaperone DnaK